MQRLKGKRAVITGAAQGLGAALAERMTNEGATVVIGDMNIVGATKTAEALEGSVAYELNVADYASCEKFMSKANEYMGGIDILVANAAIVFSGAIGEIEAAKWSKVVEVNLCGFFNTAKAAVQYMDEGSIVQINSKSV